MSSSQRIIKYCAIALAILLIVTIIFIIMNVGRGILKYAGIEKSSSNTTNKIAYEDLQTVSDSVNNVSSLNIEINTAKLQIINGDKFEVRTNNSDVRYTNENEKISVIDNSNENWFFGKKYDSEIAIIIPENSNLINDVNIKVGAGTIEITKLNAEKINLEIGAGTLTVNSIDVSSEAKIEVGAGELKIGSGKLSNLDLEVGLGKATINSNVVKDSKIECGMGVIDLNLPLSQDNYALRIEKGLGTIRFNNKSISNDTYIENGQNRIRIEGGVGTINITTKNEL